MKLCRSCPFLERRSQLKVARYLDGQAGEHECVGFGVRLHEAVLNDIISYENKALIRLVQSLKEAVITTENYKESKI
jgi:hypothetical protein